MLFCLACATMLVVFWLLAGRIAGVDMGVRWFYTVGAGIATFVLALVFPMCGMVIVDEEGIHLRRLFFGRTIRWNNISGWTRHTGGEGSDSLRLHLTDGTKTILSPWYVFGRRVDEVEQELRNRGAQPTSAGDSSTRAARASELPEK